MAASVVRQRRESRVNSIARRALDDADDEEDDDEETSFDMESATPVYKMTTIRGPAAGKAYVLEDSPGSAPPSGARGSGVSAARARRSKPAAPVPESPKPIILSSPSVKARTGVPSSDGVGNASDVAAAAAAEQIKVTESAATTTAVDATAASTEEGSLQPSVSTQHLVQQRRRSEMQQHLATESEQLQKMENDVKAEAERFEEMRRQHAELARRRTELMEQQLHMEAERLKAAEDEMRGLEQRRVEAEKRRSEAEQAARVSEEAAQQAAADKQRVEAEHLSALQRQTEELVAKRAQLETQRLEEEQALEVAAAEAAAAATAAAAAVAASASVEAPAAGAPTPEKDRVLDPKRSLFDLLAGREDESTTNELDRSVDVAISEAAEDGGDAQPSAEAEEAPPPPSDEDQHAGDEAEADDGLPPAHHAAANGQLAVLQQQNLDALYSLDAAQRTPLFYACANNQAPCAEYLISQAGHCINLADSNGDTPLHAAVSAGSGGCSKLLIANQALVDAPNTLGMFPVHLAKTRGCLEDLLHAGANMAAEDKQNRTPLFIASAMDREECVAFLIDVLDSDEEMHHVDRRGDTPLHAAACNGAEACVLLLLQSGMDPNVRNRKGFRPIELAARRSHHGCEKRLHEYQMHHSTQGYFDSVLFLATLEGHKRCKQVLADGDPYEIIRKAPLPQSESQPAAQKDMERTDSHWSLRRGRSMRLQQWGSWIAYEDPNLGEQWIARGGGGENQGVWIEHGGFA